MFHLTLPVLFPVLSPQINYSLAEGGDTKEDLQLPDYPETLAGEIRKAFDDGKSLMVTVMGAMGHEQLITYKEESA